LGERLNEVVLPVLCRCGRELVCPECKESADLCSCKLQPRYGAVLAEVCQHDGVRKIGEDIDQNGKPLALIRCQQCGLLICEYLPADCESSPRADVDDPDVVTGFVD
jgi:hypothetical protein